MIARDLHWLKDDFRTTQIVRIYAELKLISLMNVIYGRRV